jgi:hypothetical protein
MSARDTTIQFAASPDAGEVSALLHRPDDARVLIALAHGAGAGMRHAFMQSITDALARNGVATFRYQFPYMENGIGRPDPQPLLLATVRSAVDAAHAHAPDLPLFAGGKSMGGRMTSLAAAAAPLPGVHGIVFIGFPLHPAKRPGIQRAEHLAATTVPLLFVQGTRDTLAELELLQPVVQQLGERSRMHIIDDADHGFAVRRRTTGRSNADVIEEIAAVSAGWCDGLRP